MLSISSKVIRLSFQVVVEMGHDPMFSILIVPILEISFCNSSFFPWSLCYILFESLTPYSIHQFFQQNNESPSLSSSIRILVTYSTKLNYISITSLTFLLLCSYSRHFLLNSCTVIWSLRCSSFLLKKINSNYNYAIELFSTCDASEILDGGLIGTWYLLILDTWI